MESNWRWNVAETGFSGAGLRFMARVVNTGVDDVFIVPFSGPLRRYAVIAPYIFMGRLVYATVYPPDTWEVITTIFEPEPD